MLAYFKTTFLILLYAIILSFVWAMLVFQIICFKNKDLMHIKHVSNTNYYFLMPSLVYATLLIIFTYKFLGINLIFPILFKINITLLLLKSIIPAIILLLSNGILFKIYYLIHYEFYFWKPKPFVITLKTLGFSYQRILFTLVLIQSFIKSWTQSLLWLFCELVIIEALFNAPGLGLNLIHTAKTRDISAFFINLSYLLLLYMTLFLGSFSINYWIGKKLKTYA